MDEKIKNYWSFCRIIVKACIVVKIIDLIWDGILGDPILDVSIPSTVILYIWQ